MVVNRWADWIGRAGVIGCAASVVFATLAPGPAHLPAVQWAPWLAGLFLLGIPHGACDHVVGGALRGVSGRAAGPGFYAAYLSAGLAVLACWFVSPPLASAGFLIVAAAHFGQGDVYWSRESGLASLSDSLGYRGSLLAVRSALPIALPLLAHPGEFSAEAEALAARLFGRSGWTIPPSATALGLAAVAAIVGLQVGWAALIGRRGGVGTRRAAAVDAGETLVLVATFWLVPPVLALGVYFNAWHSLRHVGRLMEVDPTTRRLIEADRPASALAAFAGRAWPMTLGALALMVALAAVIGRGLATPSDLGMLALVSLSALTLPHVLVVAWMDVRQGVWAGAPSTLGEVDHVRG